MAKHITGIIFCIPLPDGSFSYCQHAESPYTIFFNWRTNSISKDVQEIANKPILFALAVQTSTIKHWIKIGKMALLGDAMKPIKIFWQDSSNFERCIISSTDGFEKMASPEECVGLECAAVWEAHHVEERIIDHYTGRENKTEIYLSVRLKNGLG